MASGIIGRLGEDQHDEVIQKMTDVQKQIRNSLAIYCLESIHKQTLSVDHRAIAGDRIHLSPD